MNRDNSRSPSAAREDRPLTHSRDEVRHLLRFEEAILQSIYAGSPLPDVLNQICSALDCQIGNVVSVIAPAGDHASQFAAIAAKADLFGLSTFCSERILAENNALLGSLNTYCIYPRTPSPAQFLLIERAKCLAILAIKLAASADHQFASGPGENQPLRARLLEWPLSPD